MGFADTMAGLGRGLLAGIESIASQVLPAFVQAGTGFLLEKAFPGQTASLPPGRGPLRFPQGDRPRAPFPGERPFGFPPLVRTAPVFQPGLTTPGFNPFARGPFAGGGPITPTGLFGPPPSFPVPGLSIPTGGRPVHFPTSGDVSGVTPAGFPLPGGAELQFPIQFPQGIGCPQPAQLFRTGMTSARPVSMFMVPNPVTGKPTFFKHAGRPILFSGDLRACKTVARIASRARRVRGR